MSPKATASAWPWSAKTFVMAGGQRRLAVVDVADGAHVHVGLGAVVGAETSQRSGLAQGRGRAAGDEEHRGAAPRRRGSLPPI